MPPSATLPRPKATETPPKMPAPPKPKALTFARLKPHLKDLPPDALIALIERLHGVSTTNKFLLAGTFEPTAPIHSKEMETLKKRLQRLIAPKAYNKRPRLAEALALIKDYQKTNDDLGLCDLYLTVVETVFNMLAQEDYRAYRNLIDCTTLIDLLIANFEENKVAANRLFKARFFELRRLAIAHQADLDYGLVLLLKVFTCMAWQEEAEAEAPWPPAKLFPGLYQTCRPLVMTDGHYDDDEA